jgi:hypothetical protein
MLRFSCPLTAAATAIFLYCLELSSDWVVEFESDDDWRDAYPLSARCFTCELARETLEDLVAKLRLPEEYMPTEYHWLLMYECLNIQTDLLNDIPEPFLIEQLHRSGDAREESYLSLPRRPEDLDSFYIDFDELVDKYFWDIDFLLDAETFSRLDAEAKKQLAFSEGLFGVIHGLPPHPEELVLRKSDSSQV